ncbi:MAG: hypothetical protein Q7U23_09995 [Methylococcales bacterium]|nr:hypothetical protein [Methylococcales bacterium]
MSFLPQQPSNVTEILSASVKLYAESFTKVIGYSLIVFVLNSVLSSFITDAMPAVDATLDAEEQMAAAMQMLPSTLGIAFIAILFSCVLYSAMIYRIDNLVNQRADDFVGVLLLAVKKFPAIIVAGILYTIAITIGSLLLVIPAIILMISLAFCGYFILLEDLGGYESLMASHRLVWGDWWRTNIVFFVPTLVIFIVFFMMAFFGGITDPTAESSSTLNIASELLAAVITPYFYVIGYLQYHDLKLRKKM